MDDVARGPKRPVNMTLSENFVIEARKVTGNLSETVEQLLAEFIATRRAKGLEPRTAADQTRA